RFKGDAGKFVVAPVVEKGETAGRACRVASPYWYGKVNGKAVRLSTNKAAAEVMLHDLIRRHARGEAGMADPHEAHRKRSVGEPLEDWRAALLSSDAPQKHVRQTVACVARLLDGCGFSRLSDVAEAPVRAFLAGLRGDRETPDLPGQGAFTRDEL